MTVKNNIHFVKSSTGRIQFWVGSCTWNGNVHSGSWSKIGGAKQSRTLSASLYTRTCCLLSRLLLSHLPWMHLRPPQNLPRHQMRSVQDTSRMHQTHTPAEEVAASHFFRSLESGVPKHPKASWNSIDVIRNAIGHWGCHGSSASPGATLEARYDFPLRPSPTKATGQTGPGSASRTWANTEKPWSDMKQEMQLRCRICCFATWESTRKK